MDEQLRKRIDEREGILSHLKSCLISNLNLRFSPEEMDPDTPLFISGVGLDSVDALEVVIIVEREFGVQIPDGDIASVRNLNYITDFILDQRGGAAS